MKNIGINEIKEIRAHIGATHLVLFAVAPDGTQHVATHGETERNAKEAAEAGNNLKRSLGWDESLCKAKPLERKCGNCTFYEPNYGTYCMNGWSKNGDTGFCQLEPTKTTVDAERKCRYFEPKY